MFIRNGALVISLRDKKRHRYSPSYRFVLAILLVLCGLVPMVGNNRAMADTYVADQIEAKIVEIQGQAQVLASEIAKTKYLNGQADASLDAEILLMSYLYDGRVMVIDRNCKVIRDTYKLDEGKINISEEVIRCFRGSASQTQHEDEYYMEFVQPSVNGINGQIEGCLMIGVSTEAVYKAYDRMLEKNDIRVLGGLLVMIPMSILLSGFLVRPYRKLQDELTKAADGDLENMILVDDYIETAQMSEAYNRTLDKLRQLDESRQQFVSNVSHELKTPITSIRVLADSLLSMGDAPAELYREFLDDISEEIDRENRIIEDLLSLVRLDKSNQELNISQVNLNLFMEGLLKRLRPLAERKQVELILESYRPVMGEIDEMKLSLALSNIIENAIKYNVEDGWVRVTLNADHKYFYVKVADSGIGIPAEAQAHVFERFYRADKSRSRETGGTGLGLAITQSIVYLHHGAIKMHSEEGVGTTFTIRVPMIYIP